MRKFKIEEKEYVLPEVLNIDSYVKIFKVKDLFEEADFPAKVLSIITGADYKKLMECNYEEVLYLSTKVLELIPKNKDKFYDRFELDGIHYGFITDWKNMTFAEFMDLDTLSTKKPEEMLDYLHIIMGIMYRPIISEKSEHDFQIEKYNVDTMKERAELFKKKLDIKYVLSAQFFFINYARRFLNYIQASSIPNLSIGQKIKIMWKMRKTLYQMIFNRYMGGSQSSTELLETILQNTK